MRTSAVTDRYRTIFDESPEPMWLFDDETLRFLDVNQAAVAVYGYSREEFLAMDITAIRPPEDVPRLLGHLTSGGGARGEWKHWKKDGAVFDVEVATTKLVLDGRRVRLAIARDVSQKIAIEEQLRQAQKIETVGQLAGGIAHDFNNLLTAIVGHAEVLVDWLAPGDPRAAEVAAIREAADLAAGLTRQLLAFSREQRRWLTTLDLNDIVARTRLVLQRVVGEGIRLETRPAVDIWPVRVDANQIEQIILNLAINARDAMPMGGVLIVQTANVSLDAALARRRNVEPGDYVELSVADTGTGLTPSVREHLFEPFFTTKERGRGTGLGLAAVYGIVKQSGGHISVESEEGRGSRFSIFLPAVQALVAASLPGRAQAERGSETVLLVEDDLAVRTLIGDVLRRRGYQLIVAEDGPQAVRLAAEHESSIHLLITALATPGMNGLAVAEAVRAKRPETRVLYVSAYTDDSMTRDTLEAGRPAPLLHKPFTPDVLARKVRAVLEMQSV